MSSSETDDVFGECAYVGPNISGPIIEARIAFMFNENRELDSVAVKTGDFGGSPKLTEKNVDEAVARLRTQLQRYVQYQRFPFQSDL